MSQYTRGIQNDVFLRELVVVKVHVAKATRNIFDKIETREFSLSSLLSQFLKSSSLRSTSCFESLRENKTKEN